MQSLNHRLLIDSQNRAIGHRRGRPHPQSLAGQATLSEKAAFPQDSHSGFFPGLRDDGQLDLALLNIEYGVGSVSLGKDCFALVESDDLSSIPNRRQKRIRIELSRTLCFHLQLPV